MKKIAFYTVFTGNNNTSGYAIPQAQEGFDNYFFTNNETLFNILKDTQWIPKLITERSGDDYIASTMDSKRLKVNPFLSEDLSSYEFTCFRDTKIDSLSMSKVLDIIKDNSYAMALIEHWFLQPEVYAEFNESMLQPRYKSQEDQILSYIRRMESEGLSLKTSYHLACGFIIRNMKHKDVERIGKTWQEHINECGIQDQISMFFVKQLFDRQCFRTLKSADVYNTNM